MPESILDPRIYGLIYVTGLFGVGKTTFATTLEHPKLTWIIDFDLKFKAEAERQGFWYRSPEHVQDIFNFDYPAMVTWFRQAISDIPEGITVVTIDNAAPLEGLLGYIVSQAPEKYGVNPSNARSGAFGGVNPGINKLWKNITLHLQKRGVRVIFVVSHVGSPWINGQPVPNKFKGKGSRALQELANLSVVLVKDKQSAPAGLVIKEQFAQRVFADGEWTVKQVFPLRFPKATWKEIRGYFDNPADFVNPKPGEIPTRQELEMYGDILTTQQIEFIQAVANGTYIEDGDAPQFVPPTEPAVTKPAEQPATSSVSRDGECSEDLEAFAYRVMVDIGFFESCEEIAVALDHLGMPYSLEQDDAILELLKVHVDALPIFTKFDDLLFRLHQDFNLSEALAKAKLKKFGFGSFPKDENGQAKMRSRRMYWKVMMSEPPKVVKVEPVEEKVAA